MIQPVSAHAAEALPDSDRALRAHLNDVVRAVGLGVQSALASGLMLNAAAVSFSRIEDIHY